MKALLATIIDNINYGTYLQAYATVRLLQEKGWQIEILNYIRPHLNLRMKLLRPKKKGVFGIVSNFVNVVLDKYMRYNLKRFLQTKVNLTKEFTDWSIFSQKLPKYNLYLVGSDQVWNTIHNHGIDEVFYFGGIEGTKKSYASSVGQESFNEKDYARIKALLRGFSKLSVRESFGVDILNKLGFDNIEQVLDPTLMINGNEWNAISKSSWKKREPYLLVYSVEVNRDPMVLAIAKKIAKQRNLKVYMVSPYIKSYKKYKVNKIFSLADTDKFLKLFSQADYAVVSSFHGTAFAINFNVPFVTVAPDRFNTRVKSLLQLLNLKDRYISDVNKEVVTEINYEEVNRILDQQRAHSNAIIDELLTID